MKSESTLSSSISICFVSSHFPPVPVSSPPSIDPIISRNHTTRQAGTTIIIMNPNPNPNPPFLSSSSSSSSSAASQALPIDNRVPFMNLSTVRMRMDSVQQFLSQTLTTNTLLSPDQLHLLSSEILSALHQTIVNGAALLSCSSLDHIPAAPVTPVPAAADSYPIPFKEDDDDKDVGLLADLDASNCEIVELDAVELLAEHIHFCEICGKGFKRDANLRMHMRAHGNQFKTPEALSKPVENLPTDGLLLGRNPPGGKIAKFSCPFQGCNRNKGHKKFRPLKSVICVKNHFKRSHCPKMYSCNRCNKKSFSVLADLKSHLKHCGENKWRCSCGTSFSRKDKLFGHLALFEGHMPVDFGDCSVVGNNTVEDDEDELTEITTRDEDVLSVKDEGFEYCGDVGGNTTNYYGDDGFFEGLLDGFGSMGGYSLQDVLNGMHGFNGGL